ncbi:MAG: glycosyltransferase family 4 protein [Nanoarchaeota archaeon]
MKNKKKREKTRNKKIKVYLQFPWKFTDSSYYKYLLTDSPKNIEYLNTSASKGVITNKKKFLSAHKTKHLIKKIIKNLKIPIPNAHLTKTKKEFDIIHGAHCLSLHRFKPWVTDIEEANQFYVGNKNKLTIKIVKKILNRKNCKRIIAWTEWSKKNILKDFPELKNKIEVVYPAMPVYFNKKRNQEIKKQKKDKINLLFVSRRFYFKGGLQAVELMDRITKKHKNVNAIIISDTPKEILKKYGKNKKIKFSPLISQDKIFNEIYPKTDIIIYPAFTDTFGFVNLEALSFGIPLIGVKGHCNEEIIENGKTGYLVKFPEKKVCKENLYTLKTWGGELKEMQKATEKLIKNKKFRDEISNNCIKELKYGKFSIRERNKRLKIMYQNAVER